MHSFWTLTALAAVVGAAAVACDRTTAAGAPTPIPSVPAAPARVDAILEITSFAVTVRADGAALANFILREAGGQSSATVVALRFADSAGHADVVDAWCLDSGLTIEASSTLDARTLGYCQPLVRGASSGDITSLTVEYRQSDGRESSVSASAAVP
jgi:hypothetical protein